MPGSKVGPTRLPARSKSLSRSRDRFGAVSAICNNSHTRLLSLYLVLIYLLRKYADSLALTLGL